jgi:hypothetical protein
LRARDVISLLVMEPKPLRCRATASDGVVRIGWDTPREGTIAWLAWQGVLLREQEGESSLDCESLARSVGRAVVAEVSVLGAARDETLLVSLADVQRWQREYPIVRGGYGFDSPENPLAKEWPAYREARFRGALYLLRFGEISTSAA